MANGTHIPSLPWLPTGGVVNSNDVGIVDGGNIITGGGTVVVSVGCGVGSGVGTGAGSVSGHPSSSWYPLTVSFCLGHPSRASGIPSPSASFFDPLVPPPLPSLRPS